MSNTAKCPHCHRAIELTAAGGSWSKAPDAWRPMGLMQSSHPWQPDRTGPGRLEQSAALGASLSAERRTPARAPEVGADVVVPVFRGVALGVAAGILAIGPTIIVEAWPWYTPLVVVLVVTPAAVIGWLFHTQSGWWVTERITQEPPDPPEPPAEPPAEIVANVRDEETDQPSQKRFGLPEGVSDEKFYDFLVGVSSAGRTLARSDWVGKGRPLSRAQHTKLINELARIRAVALVEPDRPTMGYTVTRVGRRLFEDWIAALETRRNSW